MIYAIISDIHSNIESLEIFKKIVDYYKPDKIICLGDIVGYYTNPNECIELLRDFQNITMIRGNHDTACITGNYTNFSYEAQTAVIWTIKNITKENMEYLRKIPKGPLFLEESFYICHGSVENEDNYILSPLHAKSDIAFMKKNKLKLGFFGHTHYQSCYCSNNSNNSIYEIYEKRIVFDPSEHYLVNPGSLGQPRDGDRKASFALFDSDRHLISLIRYDYPYQKTKEKVLKEHLPYFLAERLEQGI